MVAVPMDVPPDQYKLYAEFGIAAEKAQVLEVQAGNVALLYVAMFYDRDKLTEGERKMFRGILDDCDRSTLGKLLKRVKSTGHCDEAILSSIDEALERRNYLMHHFYRTHNFGINSEAGRKEMIAELKDIQAKLERAHLILVGIGQGLEKFAGLDNVPEHFAKEVARVQQAGKKVDL
jgi:hypothetical protein